MMSIFGELDAEKIPSNPYWVEEGEYKAQITNAVIQKTRDGEKTQLVIDFTIIDPDSEFFNNKVRSWNTVYPELTQDSFNMLPAEEKKAVRRDLVNLKRLLCGQPEQGRKGLGVDPDELDNEWDPKSLHNLEVDIAVANSGNEHQFVNLRWANLVDS